MPPVASGGAPPEVSVIVPAYESQRTLGHCLAALRAQTHQSFELIVVDSSRGTESEHIVNACFPEARCERPRGRLLPQAALNCGVALSRGALLAFISPDEYAHPRWLERLVAAHRLSGATICGSLACFGKRWVDRGVHLCKFSRWLPAGGPRAIDVSPSGNMLIARRDFDAAGGLPGDLFLGDVELSRRLRRLGRTIRFEPAALVEHHHLHGLTSFLHERFARGMLYGELRCAWLEGRRGALLLYLLASVIPLRLLRILALVAGHAAQAGKLRDYVSTLPVILVGESAWVVGEAVSYARGLRASARREPVP
jgi:GT2 family glycosyltransferase